MSQDDPDEATMVDMVFPLAGHSLPRDHAQALQQALQQALPWLPEEPLAGIHPLKLVSGGESQALLSQRTRLLLRLPRARVALAQTLAGRTIEVDGSTLQLGAPHLRELLPHTTLYAPGVAAAGVDEGIFMEAVAGELQALAVRAQTVCGKRGSQKLPGQVLTTFSLMLHALSLADSRRLQEQGLGPHRLLGCGIFVPHKSAAAVGS
ncbi:MAG: type I-MYXAN CRISPR-associated protein Cas6/Cmx6 [Burkholderiales bacterium]|nr:type I-MYXAN CRISPR-associated protein Cas6/Cmx6 [Burkholderiales bacterium]